MFFDRPELGRRAVLVTVQFTGSGNYPQAPEAGETRELATGAGLEVCDIVRQTRRDPHPKTFIGGGKVEELKALMEAYEADLLLLNHDVGPGQQRELEALLDARVMPRTELILHIFADRAASHEGKLQVELAQLKHAQTRLVRGWTHLDRQKGGIGMRGAGETQIEMDQRMLGERVKTTTARLATVARQRAARRRRRERREVPLVALVGYTNAGKSTLFNRLTEAAVLAEDRLFATLDPTARQLALPGVGHAVLSDTVGFISQLPHSLVNAFQSTLEDVAGADLLLHVMDATAPDLDDQREAVDKVLFEIGAASVPQLLVLNKADRLPAAELPRFPGLSSGDVQLISALTGSGIDALLSAMAGNLRGVLSAYEIHLQPGDGKNRAWLYAQGVVDTEATEADGTIRLVADLDPEQHRMLAERVGVERIQGLAASEEAPAASEEAPAAVEEAPAASKGEPATLRREPSRSAPGAVDDETEAEAAVEAQAAVAAVQGPETPLPPVVTGLEQTTQQS